MILINITNKYRPRTKEEFIGNKDILEDAIKNISNNIHVLVTGDPGIGKTCMGYLIADILNLSVTEINPSMDQTKEERKKLIESMKTKSLFGDTLYLLDEIESFNTTFVEQIYQNLKKAQHPVFITANDSYKVSYKLKRFCKYYQLKPPNLGEVVKRINTIAKKNGIPKEKINYKRITQDVRSSIISSLDDSNKSEKKENPFEQVRNVFRNQKEEDIHPAWLMDNLHNFYHGYDVYKAIKILRYAIETDDTFFYTCLPKSKQGYQINYPYYFRRK